MLTLLIVILLIFWLVPAVGGRYNEGLAFGGNGIHLILVVVLILLLFRFI